MMNKKLILLALGLISILGIPNTHAQDDKLIMITIPESYNIKDKIILVNNSTCTILRGVVILADTTEQVVLGTCNLVGAGGSVTLASFDKNRLKMLRGRTIGIKIKGVKKAIFNQSVSSFGGAAYASGPVLVSGAVAHSEVKAEDVNNLQNDESVTYDFSAKISEARHDLYINVYDNNNGEGVLKF